MERRDPALPKARHCLPDPEANGWSGKYSRHHEKRDDMAEQDRRYKYENAQGLSSAVRGYSQVSFSGSLPFHSSPFSHFKDGQGEPKVLEQQPVKDNSVFSADSSAWVESSPNRNEARQGVKSGKFMRDQNLVFEEGRDSEYGTAHPLFEESHSASNGEKFGLLIAHSHTCGDGGGPDTAITSVSRGTPAQEPPTFHTGFDPSPQPFIRSSKRSPAGVTHSDSQREDQRVNEHNISTVAPQIRIHPSNQSSPITARSVTKTGEKLNNQVGLGANKSSETPPALTPKRTCELRSEKFPDSKSVVRPSSIISVPLPVTHLVPATGKGGPSDGGTTASPQSHKKVHRHRSFHTRLSLPNIGGNRPPSRKLKTSPSPSPVSASSPPPLPLTNPWFSRNPSETCTSSNTGQGWGTSPSTTPHLSNIAFSTPTGTGTSTLLSRSTCSNPGLSSEGRKSHCDGQRTPSRSQTGRKGERKTPESVHITPTPAASDALSPKRGPGANSTEDRIRERNGISTSTPGLDCASAATSSIPITTSNGITTAANAPHTFSSSGTSRRTVCKSESTRGLSGCPRGENERRSVSGHVSAAASPFPPGPGPTSQECAQLSLPTFDSPTVKAKPSHSFFPKPTIFRPSSTANLTTTPDPTGTPSTAAPPNSRASVPPALQPFPSLSSSSSRLTKASKLSKPKPKPRPISKGKSKLSFQVVEKRINSKTPKFLLSNPYSQPDRAGPSFLPPSPIPTLLAPKQDTTREDENTSCGAGQSSHGLSPVGLESCIGFGSSFCCSINPFSRDSRPATFAASASAPVPASIPVSTHPSGAFQPFLESALHTSIGPPAFCAPSFDNHITSQLEPLPVPLRRQISSPVSGVGGLLKKHLKSSQSRPGLNAISTVTKVPTDTLDLDRNPTPTSSSPPSPRSTVSSPTVETSATTPASAILPSESTNPSIDLTSVINMTISPSAHILSTDGLPSAPLPSSAAPALRNEVSNSFHPAGSSTHSVSGSSSGAGGVLGVSNINSMPAKPPDMASLIKEAGSPEAALLNLWKEKQTAHAHNAQLWGLVEKQRSALASLTQDVDRLTKERDKYRRRLKDYRSSHSGPSPGPSAGSASERAVDEATPQAVDEPVDAAAAAVAPTSSIVFRSPNFDAGQSSTSLDSSSKEDTKSVGKGGAGARLARKGPPKPLNLGGIGNGTRDGKAEDTTAAGGPPTAIMDPKKLTQSGGSLKGRGEEVVDPHVATHVVVEEEVPARGRRRTRADDEQARVQAASMTASQRAQAEDSDREDDDPIPQPQQQQQQQQQQRADQAPIASVNFSSAPKKVEFGLPAGPALQQPGHPHRPEKGGGGGGGLQSLAKTPFAIVSPTTETVLQARPPSPRMPVGLPLSPRPSDNKQYQQLKNQSMTALFRQNSHIMPQTATSARFPSLSEVLPVPLTAVPKGLFPHRENASESTQSGFPQHLTETTTGTGASGSFGTTTFTIPEGRGPMPMGLPATPRPDRSRFNGLVTPGLPTASLAGGFDKSLRADGGMGFGRNRTNSDTAHVDGTDGKQFRPLDSSRKSVDPLLAKEKANVGLSHFPDSLYSSLKSGNSSSLLTPDSLGSIAVFVSSSRLRPSRQSIMNGTKISEEDYVLLLGVHSRMDGRQLWRVEKSALSLANLHAELSDAAKKSKRGSLPFKAVDRSLFAGHAPTKVDARRDAVDNYFARVCNFAIDGMDAAGQKSLCTYLSSDMIASENSSEGGSAFGGVSGDGGKKGPQKEGYLTKRGKNFGGWKSRYFVLNQGELRYYEVAGGPCSGIIVVADTAVGSQSEKDQDEDMRDENDSSGHQFRHAFYMIELRKKTKHVFCAESDAERDSWVAALTWYTRKDGSGQISPPALETQNHTVQSIRYQDTKAAEPATAGQTGWGASGLGGLVSPGPGRMPSMGFERGDRGALSPDDVASTPMYSSFPSALKSKKQNILTGLRNRIPRDARKTMTALSAQFSSGNHSSSTSSAAPPPLPFNNCPVFAVPLDDAVANAQTLAVPTRGLPTAVFRCLQYLSANKAEEEEGLFRLSGSNQVIRDLRDRFNQVGDVCIGVDYDDDQLDVHAVAGLLKLFFRELPSPLLTPEVHARFQQVMEMDAGDRARPTAEAIMLLPHSQQTLLMYLMGYLRRVIDREDKNRMTIRNVGIVFAPSLNIPSPLISVMVVSWEVVFAGVDGFDREYGLGKGRIFADGGDSANAAAGGASPIADNISPSQGYFAPPSVTISEASPPVAHASLGGDGRAVSGRQSSISHHHQQQQSQQPSPLPPHPPSRGSMTSGLPSQVQPPTHPAHGPPQPPAPSSSSQAASGRNPSAQVPPLDIGFFDLSVPFGLDGVGFTPKVNAPGMSFADVNGDPGRNGADGRAQGAGNNHTPPKRQSDDGAGGGSGVGSNGPISSNSNLISAANPISTLPTVSEAASLPAPAGPGFGASLRSPPGPMNRGIAAALASPRLSTAPAGFRNALGAPGAGAGGVAGERSVSGGSMHSSSGHAVAMNPDSRPGTASSMAGSSGAQHPQHAQQQHHQHQLPQHHSHQYLQQPPPRGERRSRRNSTLALLGIRNGHGHSHSQGSTRSDGSAGSGSGHGHGLTAGAVNVGGGAGGCGGGGAGGGGISGSGAEDSPMKKSRGLFKRDKGEREKEREGKFMGVVREEE